MDVADPPLHFFEKRPMGDAVEVAGEVGVHHVRVALAESAMHFLDCICCAPLGPVAIGAVLEVRLEDGLQHELGCALRYPVPNRRDTERALAAARLGDHDPAHRIGLVRLVV